jgi:hypothetical protein
MVIHLANPFSRDKEKQRLKTLPLFKVRIIEM